MAAQRQLTAVWLSLAAMLVIQLNPPSLIPKTFKSEPSAEASDVALTVLQVLLQTSLQAFSQLGVMIGVSRTLDERIPVRCILIEPCHKNPDVVQAFFGCMEPVSRDVGQFPVTRSLTICIGSSCTIFFRYSTASRPTCSMD